MVPLLAVLWSSFPEMDGLSPPLASPCFRSRGIQEGCSEEKRRVYRKIREGISWRCEMWQKLRTTEKSLFGRKICCTKKGNTIRLLMECSNFFEMNQLANVVSKGDGPCRTSAIRAHYLPADAERVFSAPGQNSSALYSNSLFSNTVRGLEYIAEQGISVVGVLLMFERNTGEVRNGVRTYMRWDVAEEGEVHN